MAQVIDAAGRSKGFSKKKRQEPLHVPDRSSSGRVNHADYTGLAKGISNAVDKGASFASSVARKANDQLMAPVSQERRMTVSPSFASAPRQEAPKMPEIRFNPDWHGLSDQQIDEIHEQETLGPAIIREVSDLYSALNQPVEERPAVSYEELGRGASQAISDVAGALNKPVLMSPPSSQPTSQPSQMSTSGMMGEPTAISASDMQMPDVGSYVPTSPRDRRRDWTSIMAPVAGAANDAIDWLRDQSSAQVPSDDHAGRGDAWRSLGEAVGGPIDEHLRETQGYVAPRQDPTRERVSLPSVDQWSQMSEAGQFDRSARTSPLQDLVNGVVSHWDEVQNYTAPEQDPTQSKVALPSVDGWTSMGDAGQFDNSPTVTPVQDLVDMAMDHWDEVQNYTAPDQDPTRQTKVLPTVDASQVGMSSQGLDIGDADDVSKELSQSTGVDPDLVGDTEVNQSYADLFIASGADKADVESMFDRNDLNILAQLGEGTLDQTTNSGMTGDASVIDDGTAYDYNHVTSNWMTGTQYIRYLEELGLEGRPIGEIDPRAIYNKNYEYRNYGFVPFTPDWMSMTERVGSDVMMSPGRVAGNIGNIRQYITPDYTIRIGDQEVSGRDFDRMSTPYIQQVDYYMQTDPGRYQRVYELEVPEADGSTSYHYGWPTSATWKDGQFIISFQDGSTATLSGDLTDEELEEALSAEPKPVRIDDAHGDLPDDLSSLGEGWVMVDVPDLVLPDGTSLPYWDVFRAYVDDTVEDDPENENDDDISYSFSDKPLPFWFDNKPARLSSQELVTDEGLDLSDIGNKAMDFTAGSIPISLPGAIPWIFSAPGSIASLAGVDPASYDPKFGSYLPLAGYYDDDGNLRYGVQTMSDGEIGVDKGMSDWTRYANAAGNMLVPLTEQIAGNVGSDPLGRFLNVPDLDKIASPTLSQLLRNRMWGPIGEGVEEIVGNIFDEGTTYGPSAWANPVYREDGHPMTDAVGHEIRNADTSVLDRASNATDLVDAANAFAGGALVSEVMGLPGLPGRLGGYANAMSNQERMRRMGLEPYVMPEESVHQEAPDEYFDKSDNEPITWENRSRANALER